MTSSEKGRNWRKANSKRAQTYNKARYERNRENILQQMKYREKVIRLEALAAYGGQCECCGESRMEFLAFDHINGKGNIHRKAERKHGTPRWLKKHGYPKDFRILCHNCNCARGFYGYCPHEKRVVT